MAVSRDDAWNADCGKQRTTLVGPLDASRVADTACDEKISRLVPGSIRCQMPIRLYGAGFPTSALIRFLSGNRLTTRP
jgi:hypothetical protein